MEVKDFITSPVFYMEAGQMIFTHNKKHGDQLLLNVRGWGAIQHLFKAEKEAEKFQDDLGKWIADAINEKLNQTDLKTQNEEIVALAFDCKAINLENIETSLKYSRLKSKLYQLCKLLKEGK